MSDLPVKVRLQKKHPLSLRWNHWVNFPLMTIMVWSGLMIYWANAAYFLPRSWLAALGLQQRLGEGISWHFSFAVLFMLNGLLYVLFLLISGHWRYLKPHKQNFKEAVVVAAHDAHIYKGPIPKYEKYNAAQKLTYLAVLVLGIIEVLTGLAIYKPIQLNQLTSLLGGYQSARWIHFMVTMLFVAFFVVHIIQVIRSGWKNFWAMISGLEKVSDE